MKPTILILFILAVAILSCNQKPKQALQQEDFNPFINPKWNEETFIKFNAKNVSDTTLVNVTLYNTLPIFFKINKTVIPSDGTYYSSFKCSPFNQLHLVLRKTIIPIFIVPADTLTINLDFDYEKDLYQSISFSGSNKEINEYYLSKRQHLNYFATNIPASNYNSKSFTIYEASIKIDSLYNEELVYLSDYIKQSELPDWFIEIEKQNIHYGKFSFKINSIFYRNRFNQESTGKNDKYFSFLDDMVIYDTGASNSMFYYIFLSNYYLLYNKLLNEKLDTEDNITGFGRAFPLVLVNVDEATNQLDGQIRERYFAYEFSHLYSITGKKEQIKQIDTLLSTVNQYFSDTVLYNVVKKTRKHDLFGKEKSNFLNKGEIAPDFYLSDKNGEFHSSKEFRGKVVFLNFWASWCKPCIKAIPDKNSMIKKFEGKNFVFINISLDKNREDWINAINRHGLLGLHLICKGNWEEILSDKYYISGIPHYAIIDKDGKVIDNGLQSNSKEELINLIYKYL